MPNEKATDQNKMLDLVSQNSLLQHAMCQNYFSKNPSRALWDCHVLARELTDQFKKITKSCQSKIDSFYSKTSLNQSPDIISALSHKAYTISALSRKAESNSALSRKAESISERSQTDYLLLS